MIYVVEGHELLLLGGFLVRPLFVFYHFGGQVLFFPRSLVAVLSPATVQRMLCWRPSYGVNPCKILSM